MTPQACIYRILLVASLAATSYAYADDNNNAWQLGIGIGGQFLQDYRGANQAHVKIIPVPIILHNGKFLKLNRDGARGEIFNHRRIKLDISADAALSGNSKKNTARQGMPALDSALELGPSLSILLAGNHIGDGWSLRLPARAVFMASSRGINHQGYVFNPRISFHKPYAIKNWGIGFSAGALWGNKDYHDYFYTVDSLYATAERPAYQAEGGYSGTYSKVSTNYSKGDWLMGIYIRYDNLSGATFADSPLVKTKHFGAIGFGIGKTIKSF